MTTTTGTGRGSLWFALLAPPAAWSGQELLGWFFGERTCGSMTPAAVRLTVLGITVAALAVSIAGAARGWRSWRHSSAATDPLATDAEDRVEFMALGGLLVSVVFTIGIAWSGLSSAFLGDCGRMR
jgi:hypothetical protein